MPRGSTLTLFCVALFGACSDSRQPPVSSVVPDSVDQVAYGFTNYITMDGVERTEVTADSALHYERRAEWELYEVLVKFRSDHGQLRSTLTSRRGTYDWRSGNMEARDDVVAWTPDGRRLTTCKIIYHRSSDNITGPCDFVFEAPGRHLEGESFTADPDFRDVTATHPRRGRAATKTTGPR
ncbi:MAG: LPS export ABC transporter periplasmic protein LptC [Gemmatimonadales bacterium]